MAENHSPSGTITLENIDWVAERLLELLKGKRFSVVTAYEEFDFGPRVATGQTLPSTMPISVIRSGDGSCDDLTVSAKLRVQGFGITQIGQSKGRMFVASYCFTGNQATIISQNGFGHEIIQIFAVEKEREPGQMAAPFKRFQSDRPPAWFDSLTIENIDQVATQIRELFAGRRFTFALIHESGELKPFVLTGETLRPIQPGGHSVFVDKNEQVKVARLYIYLSLCRTVYDFMTDPSQEDIPVENRLPRFFFGFKMIDPDHNAWNAFTLTARSKTGGRVYYALALEE
jgi:hypothetical protein